MLKLLTAFVTLFASKSVWANPACAVCTVAIGASLTIARKLGVDDCVVGVWSGAMLAIVGYWTIRFFEKHNWNFPGRDPILMALSIAMVGFMYVGQLTYSPMIIGVFYIDSFLMTNIIGALTFIGGMNFYQWMKVKNGGHAHFPFEKVVVPVALVLLVSLTFHLYPICNCGEPTPVENVEIIPILE